MVTSIIRAVACELSYTVTDVILTDEGDVKYRKKKVAYSDFLKDWGVEVALNLTIAERTSVSPTALLTPPGVPDYVFRLAGGLSVSTEAQRIQKTNMFYRVADLYRPDLFDGTGNRQRCLTRSGNREGSPLVDSDLRLKSLLNSRLAATSLGFATSPGEKPLTAGDKNVLTQTISFKIESSGAATPSWTLVRATVNSGGTFLSAGRDNTQEVVFTFGPLDKSVPGRGRLIPLAEAFHLNTQLQTGIQNALTPFR